MYSPLPPNNPNPINKMLLSTENRIASTECPEYPQPPPKPEYKCRYTSYYNILMKP